MLNGNEIKYRIKIIVIILIINFAGLTIISAQPKISNKYGLIIIYGTKILQKEIAEDPANEMLNIKRLIPGMELDLNYRRRLYA